MTTGVSRFLLSPRHIGLRPLCLALLVWLGTTRPVLAGETTQEFWPEIDLWLRLSPSWRLSMFTALSKNIETAYREGNLILQADYAWGKTRLLSRRRLLDESRAEQMKAMLIRGGYLGGQSFGDNGEAYFDSRYDTVNRVRVIGGTSVVWSPRLALEGNVTYQHDSESSVTNLYALNVILHAFFETGRAR